MKIVVQNLQKRSGLASRLIEENDPDIFLAQEINLLSEKEEYEFDKACYTTDIWYGFGYYRHGTAMYARKNSDGESPISNVRRVECPHSEFAWMVTKKTTIADINIGGVVQYVTFHGFNNMPFRNVQKLVDHVRAVIEVLRPTGPAMFAGDFNTWDQVYLDAVKAELEPHGFLLVYSWEYPTRDFPLDHVFVRGLVIRTAASFASESDHLGAILEIDVADDGVSDEE